LKSKDHIRNKEDIIIIGNKSENRNDKNSSLKIKEERFSGIKGSSLGY
jgi:hypothetical protein